MNSSSIAALRHITLALLVFAAPLSYAISPNPQAQAPPPAQHPKSTPQNKSAEPKPPTPDEELQQTIDNAANDRAALVRNLEAFLKKYPEARQRAQIYRALVEASLQLRDNARASEYAERIVALTPEDMSMTLLSIQLLERNGDEAGLRRAANYSSRVLAYVDANSGDKSPKVSQAEWDTDKKRDRTTVLLLRGRLYLKLHEIPNAQKDFEESYNLLPSAGAAEKLAEIAELQKDMPRAIVQYARAFALADDTNATVNRREIRKKLGNVWRLAHGSDDGLGEYLLRTYDEISVPPPSASAQIKRNDKVTDVYGFTLRRAPAGQPLALADQKAKVLVVSFWATWCGPCRALEPLFERVALNFNQNHDVVFLAADCDEDEALVPAYLEEVKPRTTVVFADGLDRLLAINSYPTVVVIDRTGKISYRADGYAEDSFEQSLTTAIHQALTPGAAPPTPTAIAIPNAVPGHANLPIGSVK
ncbi:MAG TPA: thioredoxin domain-containing protein [Candidatus Acidoferrum sp.]|jgi:thiol-disulfide isomerase/thioredoxin